ncbi:MAG: carboxymuconolactone decarboxylase family protein [Pyrinomonadaceae bacterium]|nr:carboxymuconolactone decarboxylase family protein [Sphingobacteriaceae bacterium]
MATNKRFLNNNTPIDEVIAMIPKLYAPFAYSELALEIFLEAKHAGSSLSRVNKEAINLVVSQANNASLSIRAHCALLNLYGLGEDQISAILMNRTLDDPKLDALVKLTKSVATLNGHVSENLVERFIRSGFTNGDLIDLIIAIGLESINNYLLTVKIEPDALATLS